MDPQMKSTVEAFVAKFNTGLPCRIQFPRPAQAPFAPGPSEHTGWALEMKYSYHPKQKRNTIQFDLVIAFPDPLEVVDATHVRRLPSDQRKWKLFGLSSFVHTCYFNWDVEGKVSAGKLYTRPPHPSSMLEMTPSMGEHLSNPVRLDKLIPIIMRTQDPQQWVHLLKTISIPTPNPDCPKDWSEAIANTRQNPPGGRRTLRGGTALERCEMKLPPSVAQPSHDVGFIRIPIPIRATVGDLGYLGSLKRHVSATDSSMTVINMDERICKRMAIEC